MPSLDFHLTRVSSYSLHVQKPVAVTRRPRTRCDSIRVARAAPPPCDRLPSLLSGFVLGCNSSGPASGDPGDGPDLKPDFSTLLGTYRVNLTQVYLGTAMGHYEGSVTLGQLTHVDTSHTDVSGDFAGSVQLTGTIPSFGPAFGSFSPVGELAGHTVAYHRRSPSHKARATLRGPEVRLIARPVPGNRARSTTELYRAGLVGLAGRRCAEDADGVRWRGDSC